MAILTREELERRKKAQQGTELGSRVGLVKEAAQNANLATDFKLATPQQRGSLIGMTQDIRKSDKISPISTPTATQTPTQDKITTQTTPTMLEAPKQPVISSDESECIGKGGTWDSVRKVCTYGKGIDPITGQDRLAKQESEFEIASRLGFPNPEQYITKTPELEAEELLQKQQDERTQLDLKLEQKRKEVAEQLEASKGSVIASTAQGREGIQASALQAIRNRFIGKAEQRSQAMLDQYNQLEYQLKQVQEKQKEALISKNIEAQRRYALEAEQIRLKQKQADAESIQEMRAMNKEASEIKQQNTNNFFNTVEALGGMFADLDTSTLSNLIKNTNIDMGTAIMLQKTSLLQRQEDETKDLRVKEKFRLEREKMIKDIKQIGKEKDTQSMQDFKFYQELQATAPVSAKKFAIMKNIIDKPKSEYDRQIETLDIQLKKTNIEKVRSDILKQKSDLSQLSQIYGDGDNNIINKLSMETIGTVPTRTEGRYGNEGQCGAFVNDILGVPQGFFGDSFESKASKINKTINEIPSAGDVFISTIGNEEIGHVGFVKSVQLDDLGRATVTLADSNRNGDRKYGERTVTLDSALSPNGEGIVGYYSPVKASQSGVNSPVGADWGNTYKKIVNTKTIAGASRLSDKDVEKRENDLFEAIKTGDKEYANEIIRGLILNDKRVGDSIYDNAGLKTGLENLKNILTEYKESGNKTNILTAIAETGANYLGVTTDEQLAKAKNQLGVLVADYIRAISGTAASDREVQRLLDNMPKIKNIDSFNMTLLDNLENIANQRVQSSVNTFLGSYKNTAKDIFPEFYEKDINDYVQMYQSTSQQQSSAYTQEELDQINEIFQ